MLKYCFSLILFCTISILSQAQTREELEKQRQQLRKEIEETEKQLNSNKAKTKENFTQWKLINNKVALQDRVIDNISKDLRLLNDNIFTIQKDLNRYDRLLDTLKQEYAKSMVYAYKNRSNYQFMNFIFSANSFNDAIKRITYLKSYRNYQEIQGENILRTQELRKKRIEDLGGSKKLKSTTLQTQSRELAILETQEKEKDRIVQELKKQGKTLNNQIAAKKKQMQKVSSAIASAIKKAQDEARREAIAKAAADERKRKERDNDGANTPSKDNATNSNTKAVKSTRVAPVKKEGTSVLLNAENTSLNASFEKNRGSLPWPVDKGYVMMHYGPNKLPSGSDIVISNVTISTEIGGAVKSVFAGTVSNVLSIDDMQVVIIQHGKYFTTYSNLSGVSVQKGQDVTTGQTLGRVAANLEGVGAVDFFMSNETSNFDPEKWLRRR
ncbi:MAG: peptidoglycan DD-metalloendopeptidase family protein [Gloeobacteraceae cyanobacterium ES-bin-316]|nr:peptidoglycan DD-metalloendopeptidase family protein [Ferruginibacter sp.]